MTETAVERAIRRLRPLFDRGQIHAETAAELMAEPDPGYTRIDTWEEENRND